MNDTPPRMFISYSWTTPEHEQWVTKLATELRSQGVDVVLDKWDLKPGHDANAFMESMVSDETVTKVALICDQGYSQKSDRRHGGAGTEAQIITPEIYAKKRQDKFVAVVREKDSEGHPYIPVYYKGRIFIDLSDDTTYATQFEELVRWAWDKPLNVKPDLGGPPAFLQENSTAPKLATSVPFRRAIEALKGAKPYAAAATLEYLEVAASEMNKLRLKITDPADSKTFDERVIKSMEDALPFRNELLELFLTIARYSPQPELINALHEFFEKLLPLMRPPAEAGSYYEHEQDNLIFIVHELLLYWVGTLLKYQLFSQLDDFLLKEFYYPARLSEPMVGFTAFRLFMRSMEIRNTRLNLRRLSIRADLLVARASASGLDLQFLMAADIVLFIRAQARKEFWWPETLLYLNASSGPKDIEIFSRAKSKAYFDRLCAALGVRNKEDLNKLLITIEQSNSVPKWQFERFNPRQAIRFEQLATSP